jgi:hypothetical protein
MNTYGYSATYTIGFDKGLLNNVTVDMVFTAVRKLGSTISEDINLYQESPVAIVF